MATRSREKSAARKANADKRPHAIARYVRISSRKVKAVIDLIRGKSVNEAKGILMYTPKARAEAPELRYSKCGEQPRPFRRQPLCGGSIRKSGPYPEALQAQGTGQGDSHSQAHQPHHHNPGPDEVGGKSWDRKLIRTVSALA